MRVFVLSTGRCGSTTFVRACEHATNFTAGHETRYDQVGHGRLDYPDWHIEADNRLSWMLGRLHRRFPDARYVHLTREPDEVAASYVDRWVASPPSHEAGKLAQLRMALGLGGRGLRSRITTGYAYSIIARKEPWPREEWFEVCRDYVDTVEANIVEFLRDKPHVQVDVDFVEADFRRFWDWAGLDGDVDAAVGEWSVAHHAGPPKRRSLLARG